MFLFFFVFEIDPIFWSLVAEKGWIAGNCIAVAITFS